MAAHIASDGSTYRGYLLGYERHGPGTQIWDDGEIYVGEWLND